MCAAPFAPAPQRESMTDARPACVSVCRRQAHPPASPVCRRVCAATNLPSAAPVYTTLRPILTTFGGLSCVTSVTQRTSSRCPPSVATQRATVLRPLLPGPPVRSDQLHATAGQFRIQSVRLVGVVPDETRRKLPDKPLSERGVYQFDFMGRGALDVDGDRDALTIGDGHDLRPLAALRLAHAGATLLGRREAPVDERFMQIQIAFVVECLGEDLEDAPQHARADPLLKPPVAGLIRRIAVRQVGPRGPGPQDPQDAIEHGAVLPPRAPSTVFAAPQLGQEGPNEVPLLVREVTG